MASTDGKRSDLIVADLTTHGPSTPLDVARRIHRDTPDVWRSLLRMANAGQITFDPTGRIASLAPTNPTDQEPTT